MWLFYVLILLTIFLSYIINTTKPKGAEQYLKIMFFILAFLMMFRGSSVGNDTEDYAYLFQTINYYVDYYGVIDSFLSTSRYEAGFIVLNRLIGLLFKNSQWLFIFTGLFVAFAFGRFFYQYSLIPWLSTFMFLTLQFFDLSMSGLRQILAIAVLSFAYDFLIKRKLIPFVILVLVASSFHSSAITFFAFVPSIKNKSKFAFFINYKRCNSCCFFCFFSILESSRIVLSTICPLSDAIRYFVLKRSKIGKCFDVVIIFDIVHYSLLFKLPPKTIV